MSQKPLKTGLQQATCTLVAECLVRALQYLSTADSKIRAEAHNWPSGKTLRLEVPGPGASPSPAPPGVLRSWTGRPPGM